MAQCGTCVSRLYKGVIDEVIAGVKESFLDEGIDDQVLADLKQQWESKLNATKAAEHSEITQQHQQSQQQHATSSQQQQGTQQLQPASAVQAGALVPIQITVPSQQTGGEPKTITIHAPSSALASGIAGPQLQNILSSPAAAQTFALETSQAAEIIQRQLNTALQQNGVILPDHLLQYNSTVTTQVDGPSDVSLHSEKDYNLPGPSSRKKLSIKKQRKLVEGVKVNVNAPVETLDTILNQGLAASQIDGTHGMGDSSDEISDDDDEDDDEDDKDDDKNDTVEGEEEDVENDACYEDPLNSDDDVSDDGATEVFDAENVVVCQYDKITRVRNKWKLHLKDGIMNLKSKDYVFTKANGEGEW